MNQRGKSLVSLIMVFALLLTFSIPAFADTVNVSGVTVTADANATEVAIDQHLHMFAEVSPVDATNPLVNWSVSNGTGSASIDTDGILTGLTAGTVTVVATAQDDSHTVGTKEITVRAAIVPVTSVVLGNLIPFIHMGETMRPIATVSPADATDKSLTWSIIDGTGSATVSQSGVITPVSVGTFTVQVTSADGFHRASATLTVRPVGVDVAMIIVSSDIDAVPIGVELPMTASIMPAEATNKNLTWSVMNYTGEATIDPDTHILTGTKKGLVVVKATAADGTLVNGTKGITILSNDVPVHKVVVNGDASVTVDHDYQYTVTITPLNATNKSVIWSVENVTGTATISESGLLSAKTVGTVRVKATAADNADTWYSIPVTISAPYVAPDPDPTPEPTTTPAPITTPPPTTTPKPVTIVDHGEFTKVVKLEEVAQSIAKKLEETQSTANEPIVTKFTDTMAHWADKTVEVFTKLGVISGYEDGSFRPNESISRAEFATIISKVFGLTATTSASNSAPNDVDGHWAVGAIDALASNGIISGYEDGSFRPDNEISRAEIIAIISKLVNLKPATDGSKFSDLDSAFNVEQIKAAQQMGIIAGESDNRFAPDKNSTRAEALTIILNVLKLNPDLSKLLGQ